MAHFSFFASFLQLDDYGGINLLSRVIFHMNLWPSFSAWLETVFHFKKKLFFRFESVERRMPLFSDWSKDIVSD